MCCREITCTCYPGESIHLSPQLVPDAGLDHVSHYWGYDHDYFIPTPTEGQERVQARMMQRCAARKNLSDAGMFIFSFYFLYRHDQILDVNHVAVAEMPSHTPNIVCTFDVIGVACVKSQAVDSDLRISRHFPS